MPHTGNEQTPPFIGEPHGFTLIEVMIALVIFTFGILAVIGMQGTSIQGNMSAQNISEAAMLATNQVEELIGASYDDAGLSVGSHGPEYEDIYQREWTVATNTDNTKSVEITIQWNEGSQSRQVTYDLIKPQD